MANSATAQTAIPMGWKMTGMGGILIPIVCVFDTAGADLTVYHPASDEYVAIAGMQYAEASAHNLIIKSGATTLVTLEFPANTTVNDKIGEGFKAVCALGQDLIIQSVTNPVSSMLVYVTLFKMFKW